MRNAGMMRAMMSEVRRTRPNVEKLQWRDWNENLRKPACESNRRMNAMVAHRAKFMYCCSGIVLVRNRLLGRGKNFF